MALMAEPDRVVWRFVVPGQPPSMNHLYRPAIRRRRDGTTYMARYKATGVEDYQLVAYSMARRARPKNWEPKLHYVRIRYWFRLKRDIDCDNAMKALNDAVAMALGIDDRRFLPCVQDKWIGQHDPEVEIEIEG